jgi:WXG100 family type VII secretion target
MATYSLSPDGLLDTSAELRGVTNAVDAALQELNTHVTRFTNSNTGSTADAYSAAQTVWNNGLDRMRSSLGGGAAALDSIRDTYRIADTQGANLFTS